MAGCCPPAPPSVAIGGAFAEANGPESDIRKGESVECYMARGGNTTGLHDDATGTVDSLIENNSVSIDRSTIAASTDTTFKLTSGSSKTAASWAISSVPTGLTFTDNGTTAHLYGEFTDAASKPVYKITVTAYDSASEVIDTRAFIVAPSLGGKGDDIRLISPLPGAVVNSKFGPRLHPIQNVMKPHTGIDMKYTDRSVKDVLAAADGEVILCGGNPSSGYGLRVWIKHVTAAGEHLCTTTYNHLAKIYVTQGQKVMAGQKVGLEGSTGASTGNHLHFECKLPDGKFIDPEPLINGTVLVAESTAPNGDAVNAQPRSSVSSLGESESKAKQSSCEPFGPSYPAAEPPETTDAVPPSTDPFELAWDFTMSHEVGPFWKTEPQYSPGDSELDAGLTETKTQRKKTGYVNSPNYPGGETKFGVAQKPNPRIKVTTMDYASAKLTGYNNYWKISSSSCTDKADRVAIMLFDMNYLHGPGNAKTIYTNSGITSTPGDDQATQIAACEALHAARVAFIRSIKRPEYTVGWLTRANDCLAYVKSI